MWADFPKNKQLKQAIYRGAGGAGDATGDATNAAALANSKAIEAAASATSAASSATAAAASATAAASSASDAATSATNAAASEDSVATDAASASSSASAAATSATNAASSASSASTSASNASTSATNAASSASSASTSASTATTQATNAASSATAAASSASSAATSATNAANSEATVATYVADQTGNAGKYLTTDGTNASWATVSTAPSDGDKGDITVSSSGTVWTVDNSSITDAKLSLSANASNIKTAINASGTAPIYACRAWVNFNGTGTVAIRSSGNVSSITDNGTGDYTVNFTTAMPDTNYAMVGTTQIASSGENPRVVVIPTHLAVPTTSAVRILTRAGSATSGTGNDCEYVNISIFR